MKKSMFFAGLLAGVMALSLVGCAPGEENENGNGKSSWYDKDVWMTKSEAAISDAVLPSSGSFGSDVAVHDPSVFYDAESETYYAFGTHFAVASSKDLITWKQEATDATIGGTGDKTLFGNAVNWKDVLKQSVEWTETNLPTIWAPDVMKFGDKYYMYYSLTKDFGSANSVIGRVSSKNILGPYQNEEIIVKSASHNGQPNCIDPELFYDKTGKLWMVYGSHYDGIYIKELDAQGRAVITDEYDENYYGKKLWAGDPKGVTVVEGSFAFYHAESDYYYLMATYGDLTSDYNMRVARSKSPDGPYTDISGTDMAASFGGGVKLAGNYQFTGGGLKVALGHNSVTKVDGKYVVVCHVRNAVNGMHHLEAHQLFFNEAGWPVLSPDRYVGETIGKVTQEGAAGNYNVIVHTTGTSKEVVNGVFYTLAADGKIADAQGEDAGSWQLKGDYYVEIMLGGVTYKGVVAPGWREYGGAKGVYCMTATSDADGAIWLNAE